MSFLSSVLSNSAWRTLYTKVISLMISNCIDNQNRVTLFEISHLANRRFQFADLPYWVLQEVPYLGFKRDLTSLIDCSRVLDCCRSVVGLVSPHLLADWIGFLWQHCHSNRHSLDSKFNIIEVSSEFRVYTEERNSEIRYQLIQIEAQIDCSFEWEL